MQERLDTIRQNIDAIRKSGKLSHWRMVYAENLLNRVGEYLAVDRLPEAGRVAEKLERWINSHTPRVDKSERFSENPMVFWNADMLLAMSAKLKQTLLEKRQLVPSTERESTIRRLTLVEGWIREGKLLQAHDELLALRTALIARLRRSFRARLVATDLYRGTASVPAGSLVGPYNALHTLEETFHVVGERDPIWVEDFLEIYNDLFRVVERLVPQDKK
jgi:hypothetical protein